MYVIKVVINFEGGETFLTREYQFLRVHGAAFTADESLDVIVEYDSS